MNQDFKSAVEDSHELRVSEACWSCGDKRAKHFCLSCGKVQPPTPVDYFAFFGLARKLNLDITQLEKEFYELSRRLHPDLSASSNPEEQGWSLEQSSRLNDAYRTLKDPIRRTEYLLRLEGVELEEQSKAATEQARTAGQIKKQVVPPEMLAEVFELNMQLEELRMNQKMGEDSLELRSEINQQKAALEETDRGLLDELEADWNAWDAAIDSGSPAGQLKARDKMVNLLNRRSYIRNLVRDVNATLEQQ